MDVIFLVETDTYSVNSESDYVIQGYNTIVQKKKGVEKPTRIVCLVNEKLADKSTIRMDLTSVDFPSLWIEIENECGKNLLCGENNPKKFKK